MRLKFVEDYILRATAAGGMIRTFAATTKNTVSKAAAIHNTTPVASAALGRLLTAAAIVGSMQKSETDIITIGIKGDGPLQGALVTADSEARVKGYVYNPYAEVAPKRNGKLNVSAAIGKGTLSIVKDLGLKEPYVGQVPLVTGEIAEDLTYYFAKSEQIPSAVGLGVLVDTDWSIKQAGGFIIQLLPGATDEVADYMEKKVREINSLTELFEEGKTPYDILDFLLLELTYVVNEKIPVSYYCNCSKERVTKAIISMGKDELVKILQEDGKATLHCHFCNTDYDFCSEELKEIVSKL